MLIVGCDEAAVTERTAEGPPGQNESIFQIDDLGKVLGHESVAKRLLEHPRFQAYMSEVRKAGREATLYQKLLSDRGRIDHDAIVEFVKSGGIPDAVQERKLRRLSGISDQRERKLKRILETFVDDIPDLNSLTEEETKLVFGIAVQHYLDAPKNRQLPDSPAMSKLLSSCTDQCGENYMTGSTGCTYSLIVSIAVCGSVAILTAGWGWLGCSAVGTGNYFSCETTARNYYQLCQSRCGGGLDCVAAPISHPELDGTY